MNYRLEIASRLIPNAESACVDARVVRKALAAADHLIAVELETRTEQALTAQATTPTPTETCYYCEGEKEKQRIADGNTCCPNCKRQLPIPTETERVLSVVEDVLRGRGYQFVGNDIEDIMAAIRQKVGE